MRVLRRILRWAGLALASLVALYLLYAGLVLLPYFRKWLASPPSNTQIVAQALGWSSARRLSDDAVIARLRDNPNPIVALALQSDSPASSAARKLLNRCDASRVAPAQFSSLAALLPQCLVAERWGMLTLFRSGGEPGHLALAECLDTVAPVEANLRAEIVGSLRIGDSDKAYADRVLRRLCDIATDGNIAPQNRCAVIEAIGRSERLAEPFVAALGSLGSSAPLELGAAVGVAISRIRNTPELPRLIADLDLGRRDDCLGAVIRDIAELGPAAHAIGSELLKELKPLGEDTGAIAAFTLARIGFREAIPELRVALHCASDWRLVAAAAEALGRLRAKEAEAELAEIAEHHWEPLVREVARNAISAINGKHEYKEPMQGTWCLEYDRLELERLHRPQTERPGWSKWDAFREYTAMWRERWRVSLVRLVSPVVTEITGRDRHGRAFTESWWPLPRHRLRYAGGTLLGYDEGEFASGLVFVPKQGNPLFLPTQNVTQLMPWHDSVLVLSETAMLGDCMLHRVRTGTDGVPTVEPFMRMPFRSTRCTVEASGALNFYGQLRLTTDGELETIPALTH